MNERSGRCGRLEADTSTRRVKDELELLADGRKRLAKSGSRRINPQAPMSTLGFRQRQIGTTVRHTTTKRARTRKCQIPMNALPFLMQQNTI